MIVPTLLTKASPGPVVRKKPAARSHIVGSERKRRVSVLRRKVFFAAVAVGGWWSEVVLCGEVGGRVP